MVRAAFLHPDLGIGGAERLVVDAGLQACLAWVFFVSISLLLTCMSDRLADMVGTALALQARGHQVQFFTNHHDPSHAFRETTDGTVGVAIYGDW